MVDPRGMTFDWSMNALHRGGSADNWSTARGLLNVFVPSREKIGVLQITQGDLGDYLEKLALFDEDVRVSSHSVFAEGVDRSELHGGACVLGLSEGERYELFGRRLETFATDVADLGRDVLVLIALGARELGKVAEVVVCF